jgi:hypothetical protein
MERMLVMRKIMITKEIDDEYFDNELEPVELCNIVDELLIIAKNLK